MDLSDGLEISTIVIGIFGAVIALVLKGIYGLICKNEVKSDQKDIELFNNQHEMEGRYRNNDRELYQQVGDVRCDIAYMKGLRDGRREK